MSLHFWKSRLNGTGDYIIAADVKDAQAVLLEMTGDEDLTFHPRRTWEQWPDDEPLNLVYVDEAGHPTEERTARQIVAERGRGYWSGWA